MSTSAYGLHVVTRRGIMACYGAELPNLKAADFDAEKLFLRCVQQASKGRVVSGFSAPCTTSDRSVATPLRGDVAMYLKI